MFGIVCDIMILLLYHPVCYSDFTSPKRTSFISQINLIFLGVSHTFITIEFFALTMGDATRGDGDVDLETS